MKLLFALLLALAACGDGGEHQTKEVAEPRTEAPATAPSSAPSPAPTVAPSAPHAEVPRCKKDVQIVCTEDIPGLRSCRAKPVLESCQ